PPHGRAPRRRRADPAEQPTVVVRRGGPGGAVRRRGGGHGGPLHEGTRPGRGRTEPRDSSAAGADRRGGTPSRGDALAARRPRPGGRGTTPRCPPRPGPTDRSGGGDAAALGGVRPR